MKITYKWLSEILGFKITPQEMMDQLVRIGHEIGEVIDLGLLGNPIRIARVVKVEPHPAAAEATDANPHLKNLTICTVDDGSPEPATVVCGAPNVAEGVIAVLARSGAKLPDGKVLRKAKVRGVPSEGMLLAPDEMGLGTDHTGLLLLDETAKVGEGYDVIMDLEITSNRADCLSIVGIARDLAAAMGRKLNTIVERVKEGYEHTHEFAKVSIKCPEECPRYTARVIRGVHIAPSPVWMQQRLLAVGLRPINNVVDITNYVLWEQGHPLHAFDYEKLHHHEIVVRMAEDGEKLSLLNGTTIDLTKKDMVIADDEKPVALAGIMGGTDAEVTMRTEDILLESAYFQPTNIRRTSRRHKIFSDASCRYERGADPEALPRALERATALMVEYANGKVPRGILDVTAKKHNTPNLLLRADRACTLLGINLPKTEVADLIASIGCRIVRSDGSLLIVAPPSYRVDLTREEDLYEEIARLHGYEKIPATMPYMPTAAHPKHPVVRMQRQLQDVMVSLGFSEAIHVSFIGSAALDELDMEQTNALKILNPLGREQDTLRPDLVPSMIRTMIYNQNRGNQDLQFFEVSKTFHFGDMASPCVEKQQMLLASVGAVAPANWRNASPLQTDFFYMKGVVETLFNKLGIPGMKITKGGPNFLHPGRAGRLYINSPEGEVEVGWIGELGPVYRERLGFKGRPVFAELFVDVLRAAATDARQFSELPRFPGMERDIALVLDQKVTAGKLEQAIRSAAGALLENLFLFDTYSGGQIAEGKKSLAYRLVYRHAERTLTDVEVEEAQARVLQAVAKQFSAALR
jgi:phenylalanyl-tRNA synthetase beta chain